MVRASLREAGGNPVARARVSSLLELPRQGGIDQAAGQLRGVNPGPDGLSEQARRPHPWPRVRVHGAELAVGTEARQLRLEALDEALGLHRGMRRIRDPRARFLDDQPDVAAHGPEGDVAAAHDVVVAGAGAGAGVAGAGAGGRAAGAGTLEELAVDEPAVPVLAGAADAAGVDSTTRRTMIR